MEPLFHGSGSVQVKSLKDLNNIIDKIHFTPEDSMKHFEVTKNLNIQFSDKTTLISILDNLSYYLSAFILKHNPFPYPFYPFGFLLFLCLSVSHIGSYCFCFLLFLYEDLRNSKHCIQ